MARRPITQKEYDANRLRLEAEVARLISAFANVELHVSTLLAALLKIRMPDAIVILQTVSANKVRRDIVCNIAGLVLKKPADYQSVLKIMKRVSGAAKLRNRFAHGLQGGHVEHPRWLLLHSFNADPEEPVASYEMFTLAQLRNFTRQFDVLAKDVSDLIGIVRAAKRNTFLGTRF